MAIDKKLIDQLLTDYKKPEDIIGENGLLKELTKAILERALEAELTERRVRYPWLPQPRSPRHLLPPD
jgi:hypothetical protein